jgi:hypothetical protein
MAEGQDTINQEFGLSTLHTRGQSPKAVTLQNAQMALFFDQGNRFSKGSLSRIGMDIQTTVEKLSNFFYKKKNQDLGC